MKPISKLTSFLAAVALLSIGSAEARTLKGHVSYEDGDDAASVTITEVGGGTDAETYSDLNGDFTIEVNDNSYLTLMMTGCETQIIPVGTEESIDVTLKDITPSGVDFIDGILENARIIETAVAAQMQSMGADGSSLEIRYEPSDKTLYYIYRIKNLASYGADPKTIYEPMLSGYLQQMKADGTLDIFISRMNNLGVAVAIAVIDPDYSAKEIPFVRYKGNDFRALAQALRLL